MRAAASALAGTSAEDLRRRYAADRLEALDIYPRVWDEAGVFEDYLLPHFQALVKFYADAAAEGSSMLLALT